MSSIKCVSMVAAVGGAVLGGLSLYGSMKARKTYIHQAEEAASHNNGKVPVLTGMTKDGPISGGSITLKEAKKRINKQVLQNTIVSSIMGTLSTAAIAAVTLLAKSKIK